MAFPPADVSCRKLSSTTPAILPISFLHSLINWSAEISRSAAGRSSTVTSPILLPIEVKGDPKPVWNGWVPALAITCTDTGFPSTLIWRSPTRLAAAAMRRISVFVPSNGTPTGISSFAETTSPSTLGINSKGTHLPPTSPTTRSNNAINAAHTA